MNIDGTWTMLVGDEQPNFGPRGRPKLHSVHEHTSEQVREYIADEFARYTEECAAMETPPQSLEIIKAVDVTPFVPPITEYFRWTKAENS